jgi:hypothetical protein
MLFRGGEQDREAADQASPLDPAPLAGAFAGCAV